MKLGPVQALCALGIGSLVLCTGCEWLAGIKDLKPREVDASSAEPRPGAAITLDGAAPPPVYAADAGGRPGDTGSVPLAFPRRLALGSTHSCAARGGRVLCWGSSANGQLGVGAGQTQSSPRPVVGASVAVTLAAGAAHTCLIDGDGKVSCWGRAEQGQLGAAPAEQGAVVGVDLGSDRAIQVAAGALHSCALLANGNVRCWGDNAFGQLGNGTRKPSPGVVAPTGLDGQVSAVFAAGFFTCAIKKNGGLACWGDNTFGQLGDRTKTVRAAPVTVLDLTETIQDVTLGQNTSCAATRGGQVYCWGRNRALGDAATQGIVSPFPGSPADYASPIVVGQLPTGGLPLIDSLAIGANHACGHTLADHVICWGSNVRSQLGVETEGAPRPGFHDINEIAGAIRQTAVGLSHSCAVALNDEIYCWGNNEYGQLGATPSPRRAKPERVQIVP